MSLKKKSLRSVTKTHHEEIGSLRSGLALKAPGEADFGLPLETCHSDGQDQAGEEEVDLFIWREKEVFKKM